MIAAIVLVLVIGITAWIVVRDVRESNQARREFDALSPAEKERLREIWRSQDDDDMPWW